MTNIPVTAVSGTLLDGPVTVAPGFLASYDGVVYHPGEIANVPALIATHWCRCGYATPTPAPKGKQ
jgi:hypothetical protein